MRINELINESVLAEVLKQPYKFRVVTDSAKKFVASFDTDEGRTVRFEAANASLEPSNAGNQAWTIEFVDSVTGYEETRSGNEFRTMATIVSIMRNFLSTKDPKQIYFTAVKPKPVRGTDQTSSREKLYTRMALKYAPTMGYKLEQGSTKMGTSYVLVKDTKEEINEVFSQPYNYQVVEKDSDTFTAEFTTDDRRTVEFIATEIPLWSVDFEVDGKTSITSQGDQYRILATIVKIFKQFIDEYKPETVQFSAKKGDARDSRIRLYDRMIKKVISNSGYNYERKDVKDRMLYRLNKNVDN